MAYAYGLGPYPIFGLRVQISPAALFFKINYSMLYTKRGDKGQSSLFGSAEKISKNAPIFEALGALDELNSLLGICKVKAKKHKKISYTLERVQNDLFIISANIGGSNKKLKKIRVKEMEETIDEIAKKLPHIRKFTIAGGTELSSLLDFSRAVSRRAERRIVVLHKKNKIDPTLLRYCNRLSSLLFALARISHKDHREKNPWY